jgi:hypothetical protein
MLPKKELGKKSYDRELLFRKPRGACVVSKKDTAFALGRPERERYFEKNYHKRDLRDFEHHIVYSESGFGVDSKYISGRLDGPTMYDLE